MTSLAKNMNSKKNNMLTLGALMLVMLVLALAENFLDSFSMQIFKLCAINIILALSLNLINGFTGLFSLGHAGFMAIGAYTCAVLTMSSDQKEINYVLQPIAPWLENIHMPFVPALILSGVVSCALGWFLGVVALRLRDDYLAIATLGFSEIIRVILTNAQSVTNGSLGLKGLPRFTTMWWAWGLAVASVIFMVLLIRSSYGRAFKAIRDNEIAAESMGINVFGTKVLSFAISSGLAGIAGGLLAHHLTTIDPKQFIFLKTFDILLIVVLGGVGSITGSVISAIVVTVAMEALRFMDGPLNLGFMVTAGTPGLRMVFFSILLMVVVIYRQQGLMGTNEFSWGALSRLGARLRGKKPAADVAKEGK
ncbi:MAG: branched-chain amino acid ABC transporter permease [Brachymonas sp.]|mgnify:FL=1|jgi:branched-chain amino acid transport system permease protein|nr:branched-chain amino acid ABC transporter permease [Brachymonas sp.]MBP7246214.1 branched-chain amino acid ABC transporter permease [Brachymonas sp.]MBP7724596.1 branched-chain amino acid ABC transporter permease [Brachymonas sp.]MBP7733959.1 branched-chain amino acid ABC transporter permease [Brachymonas sp.]MBP7743930.1 branched-chain amino acid ABC transporter permease [Brachymonas sp.]